MFRALWRFMPLVFLGILSIFLYMGLSLNPKYIPTTLLNKKAPSILNVNEKMMGKPWILNVWASWCAACQQEHPVMMDIAHQSGIAIIGLDYKDDYQNAKAWLNQYGNPYKAVVSDPAGLIAIDWGVYGAPETFVIDKKGIIRYKHIGVVNQSVWQNKLAPLLKELSS